MKSDPAWEKFYGERSLPLDQRYNGLYRAVVVETNDPLQFYRVRVKCPELHDGDLKPEQCPWAIPAPWLGGKGSGSWANPCIGDIVWITWEKGHPYAPIWVGFADPTRRKFYPLESAYTLSPLAVKLDETPDEVPVDYDKDYLPKDYRPMSNGFKDRYGNVDVNSTVGFFPKEHDKEPATTGQDAISNQGFNTGLNPVVNDPDRKYMSRMTKYGTYVIQSDVGYYWQRPKEEDKKTDKDLGEFRGDFVKDRDYEISRYKYLVKLLNEGRPVDTDQRRYEVRTRAGHKFEMRDVGWAQKGGGRSGSVDVGKTTSRDGDPGEARVLSKNISSDERWVKLRSKGGHLIQFMDSGFHPSDDNYYKRKLLDEVGSEHDGEKDDKWDRRDARQIRIVSRYGTKLVIDDRGSHTTGAEGEELPRGNGFLFKTVRSWEADGGFARGFGFEANDKNELNTTRWYTPKSKIIELNDRKDYAIICTDVKSDIARGWRGLSENEFALKIAMTEDPERDTYHCKLDKANGYLRLKTAAGGDNGRRNGPESFPNANTGVNQGIEARDGRVGSDGAWVEMVDIEDRGIWFSKQHQLSIWRSKEGVDQFIMIHSGGKKIVIRNNAQGPIQIYCAANVEIIADKDIALKAGRKISFKAGQEIAFEAAGSGHAKLTGSTWSMDVPDEAPEHRGRLPGAFPGIGAQSAKGSSADVINPVVITQDKIKPDDRGKTGNGPFDAIEEKIIKNYEG